MLETATWHDCEYGLAEAAILAERSISAATTPDGLAQAGVVDTTPRAPAPARPKIVVQGQKWKAVLYIDPNVPLPAPFLASVKAVVDLLDLPAGWNSFSAKPIARRNAEAAIRVLALLLDPETPPPAVVPRVKGNIQLEWHTERIDIEVYIDSPEQVRFFAEDVSTGEAAEGPLTGREEQLNKWLRRAAAG